MTPILANNMGGVRRSYNKPVADNQTIKKGDPIILVDGQVQKAAVGATTIVGFATHDVTTGVVPTNAQRPYLIYDAVQHQQFKGSLKDTQVTPTNGSLEGTDAGFVVENGEYRIDPAAATKQVIIDKVVEPYSNRLVVFRVKAANQNS